MKTLVLLATTAILASAPALAQQAQTVPPSASPTLGQPTGPGAPANQAATGAAASRAEVVNAVEFVRKAAIGDMYETQSSQLASQRAQNQQVKQFAQEMVQDHTKTTQQLQQLVQRLHTGGAAAPGAATGATTTTTTAGGTTTTGAAAPGGGAATAQGQVAVTLPQSLDAEHQQMIQRLQQAQGAEFDRLYVQQQTQAHQNAVDLFQNYARAGDVAELRQWAQQTLPDLQDHLRKVQQLQGGLRG